MSFHHSDSLPQSMMKRYSAQFEDPFAESTMAQYDQATAEGSQSPSIDRDSRYLSFSMPHFPFALLNESFQRCSINVNAQLHGMFFLAESQWPTSADTAPPPPELTCYRRNLFQITGSVTLPRSLRYIFTEEGSRIPIYELELQVSATESVEGNPVKIISVPWKTPAGADNVKGDDKLEREPPTIPLDKMAGTDMDTDYTTFPIQWKRLQFRIATANNGRRKELQQHFTLHLKIMASLSTGGKFPIAEAHSGAVIVRGRSPRNFASRKDLPLSSSSTSRKHIPSISRNSITQTSAPQITSAPKVSSPQEEITQSHLSFDSPHIPVSAPDIHTWQQQQAAVFPEPLQTPGYPMALNAPTSAPAFRQPSPDATAPFNFAFSPGRLPSTDAAVSLHFGSEDEAGSPLPQETRRSISRAPTSNPSPSLMNKTHSSNTVNMTSDNSLESSKRPKILTQQSSTNNAPTRGSVSSTKGIASSAPAQVIGFSRSNITEKPMIHRTLSVPYSPSGDGVEKLYEYFPLTVEDWRPPVDAVFRPHVVHHSVSAYADSRSPVSARSSKRYFSEVA